MRVRAVAPGRVNLIGDHTDYTLGWALPMAIDRATTVEGRRGGEQVILTSPSEPGQARVELADPLATSSPAWARYVAGVVAEVRPAQGFVGEVTSTVPVGSGLSSSAALEVAVALAIGFEGTERELAAACQRAEQVATGVPCGIMDQLTSAAGIEGHALLIDFASLEIRPVALPDSISVVVVHSGEARSLASSEYARRRAECERAEQIIGPLRGASAGSVEELDDPVLRRRARHVVTENARVQGLAAALEAGDAQAAGVLMVESHRSLRDDFEVSTPALDALVDRLTETPGVWGARLTGAGFGGCVVALAQPGALSEGWVVRARSGARVTYA